jgi:hypothetical protein
MMLRKSCGLRDRNFILLGLQCSRWVRASSLLMGVGLELGFKLAWQALYHLSHAPALNFPF